MKKVLADCTAVTHVVNANNIARTMSLLIRLCVMTSISTPKTKGNMRRKNMLHYPEIEQICARTVMVIVRSTVRITFRLKVC